MKQIVECLKGNPEVSDYRINENKKESFELFYVKGKLETVRCTDTCDKQVTVYVDHDGCKGDSLFLVYPSDTEESLKSKIATAVANARLIHNQMYSLPAGETGEYTLRSNFEEKPLPRLADEIGRAVFGANKLDGGSLNSVEVFVNRHTGTVLNSRGLCKTQHRYTAMVEAIPTFNGDRESVELYEQYNFSSLDPETLTAEIARKMEEVKARYEAVKPEQTLRCPVVLNKQELSEFFGNIAGDLNYASVYSHSNLFKKGDRIQSAPTGDPITIRMEGEHEGNICSAHFDGDGMALTPVTLVDRGLVKDYFGSNRFGQYLGVEHPTGSLGCLLVEPGTASEADLAGGPWLEVISMSGLQVDFFNDYVGGEIRLAYYHDGSRLQPVTGISFSGKVKEVLNDMTLFRETAVHDGYMGPAKAILHSVRIF